MRLNNINTCIILLHSRQINNGLLESLLFPPAVLVSQAVTMPEQLIHHVTIVQNFHRFHRRRNLGRTAKTPGLSSSNRYLHAESCQSYLCVILGCTNVTECYPFSIRKLLTATGSEACPLLCLPIPV